MLFVRKADNKMSSFPVLTMKGYKTFPEIEEIWKMGQSEKEKIRFQVWNEHGKIEFLKPVDLNNVDLDKDLEINKESVVVYKGKSPEVLEGLNVPARITFRQVRRNKRQECLRRHCERQEVKYM